MKAIITLKETQKSLELMQNLDIQELKENLEFVYTSNLEITLKGDFLVSFTGLTMWIENEDSIFLRIPAFLIKDYVIKESK